MGEKRLIIINDGHTKKRQASDLSHELSHCILKHVPSDQIIKLGLRKYDATLEEEANWLGPALLISAEAALSIARRGLSLSEASDDDRTKRAWVNCRIEYAFFGALTMPAVSNLQILASDG